MLVRALNHSRPSPIRSGANFRATEAGMQDSHNQKRKPAQPYQRKLRAPRRCPIFCRGDADPRSWTRRSCRLILVPGAGDRVDWSPMIRDQLTIATLALAISFVAMTEVMLSLMYD